MSQNTVKSIIRFTTSRSLGKDMFITVPNNSLKTEFAATGTSDFSEATFFGNPRTCKLFLDLMVGTILHQNDNEVSVFQGLITSLVEIPRIIRNLDFELKFDIIAIDLGTFNISVTESVVIEASSYNDKATTKVAVVKESV